MQSSEFNWFWLASPSLFLFHKMCLSLFQFHSHFFVHMLRNKIKQKKKKEKRESKSFHSLFKWQRLNNSIHPFESRAKTKNEKWRNNRINLSYIYIYSAMIDLNPLFFIHHFFSYKYIKLKKNENAKRKTYLYVIFKEPIHKILIS